MEEYSVASTNLALLEKDYTHSTLEFLWLYENGKRILLFGLIKAYPNEFPKQEELKETTSLLDRENKKRLFHKRISLPFKDSLAYYEKAVKNEPLSILGNVLPVNFENSYCKATSWPYFTVSTDLPFSSTYSAVRFHSLFDKNAQDIFFDITRSPKHLKWIKEKILFDIEKYREFMGSITLLAYNPLYRNMKRKALRNTQHGSEAEYIEFEARDGVDLEGLKIIFSNQNSLGFFYQQEITLKESSLAITYPDEIDRSGYAVFCPKRGLIDYSEFVSFLKSIHFSMGVITGETKVIYPTKKNPLKQDSYTVHNIDNFETQKIGEKESVGFRKEIDDTRQMLNMANFERKALADREKTGQQIIYDNDKEVSCFIRDIIGKANKRIIFIDPYLSTSEIFKFLLALSNKSTTLTAVTSATFLNTKTKRKQDNVILKEKDILNKNIETCKKSIPKLNILVMRGKNPVFHDRFLVIDNIVWSLGTSLSGLEEKRISLLVKITSPEKLLNLIEEQIKTMMPFEEWYNGKI